MLFLQVMTPISCLAKKVMISYAVARVRIYSLLDRVLIPYTATLAMISCLAQTF